MSRQIMWIGLALGLGLAAGSACGDKDWDGDSGGTGGDAGATDDGGSSDDGGIADDTGEHPPIHATVTGHITVDLYDYSTGDAVSWDDYGTTFPFGPIFVAAYQQAGRDDPLRYRGQTALLSPTAGADGDTYSLPVTLDESGNVRIYAALDWDGDTIIGSDEPRGFWPVELKVTDGGTISDVDITLTGAVNVPAGGGCDVVQIQGDAVITHTWVDGDVAIMTTTTDGVGPIWSTRVTPTADGGGASAPYDLSVCASSGDEKLIGAWDSNGNGIFDPADTWGAYASEPDVDGNPITIGSGTLAGKDVQIPLGDDADNLGVYPFVYASGTVSWSGGAFDGLPAGTVIHGLALKYRPWGDLTLTSLDTYDTVTFEPKDYAGKSSLDWDLLLPSNSVAFVWFYADTDADGILNEAGEAIGSIGTDSNGRLPTGTASSDGYGIVMQSAE